MQLRQALSAAIERLTNALVPSPRMNAELLIMFTLDCDRAYLYAHPERELTAGEMQRYDEALARRATGVPAQYITGHQEFWGLDLIVSPAVLVPRPETEHVVETVLELVSRAKKNQDQEPRTGAFAPHGAGEAPALRIVDVGTGSGAIAIALAKELPSAEIDATDISAEALEVARANAARHELTARIQFHQTDLLRGLPPRAPNAGAPGNPGLPPGRFDFVVSNPPYVGESEEDQVQLEVRKFEPRSAVFAGPTGLEVIERLIPQAREALDPGGWLVFEISGTIADRVRRLLSGWAEVAITNDLQGIARVARARKTA
ncbi:MAG: peptide chain release factor N(5)-glutamine methyltransferase [Terriglobales bacterium]